MTIHLQQLEFFAYLGIHAEEAVLGNVFLVDMAIALPSHHKIVGLNDTVNYADVYELIKQRMAQPSALLETIVNDVLDLVAVRYPFASSIFMKLEKKHPPIHQFIGRVAVSKEIVLPHV